MKHIVSKKKHIHIDGLGKKVVDQFWNLNLIKEPADIFDLNYGKLKLLKDGELSINNLKAILKSRNISLENLFTQLN